MCMMNHHYEELEESYLFAGIADRIRRYSAAHPQQRILRLGIGDVSQPLTESVIQALHEAVDDQAVKKTFHGYMPECGSEDLRKTIAAYYRKKGCNIGEEEVFVSSGASDELGDILHLFDRSIPVLLSQPAYPAYADANIMDGRKIIYLWAEEGNGFRVFPPKEEMTSLIYICSPNNPTGAVYEKELLQAWVDYAIRTDSIILFDAAYEAYIADEDIPHSIFELRGAKDCAIEICSLSKTAGFTGTRCGYTVIPEKLTREGMNLNTMWIRNRTTRTNGVSYILQKGAEAVFSEKGQKEVKNLIGIYRHNAKIFMRALDEAGFWYIGGRNAPYIWVRCPNGMSSWDYFDFLLEKAQIIGTPGSGFGPAGEGYIRFSMFADAKDIEEAGSRIIQMELK